MASLSTHVLDTASGRPAAGVRITLSRADGSVVAQGVTDDDGRIAPLAGDLARADHRLTFDTGAWFAAQGVDAFFPEVVVAFRVVDDGHHHVPLLLSPFGYSTYRGS